MSNNKKLARSKDNRMFAGVCGGLGHYFNVDPTLIRALFVLFSVFVGGGVIAYIILWIVMPEESSDPGMGKVISEDEPYSN
ncbi:MAG: PspC domain-containing protein [Chloroflexi bacterium]|jgi:phage shock protein PspC (stress-responsive transcriptional regulator)|nr:PspC domain-containing protein [Chloroflexota bacterium]MBK6711815.1 PspC domain-containing protein [Chloroflexota bacterium]MBK8931637.1 PspC domain-containing protein [Chloroflexota bacterium]MBP6805078.1 PspC domain-containing protein [Chloroflexota bacterium]MBP7591805.1 PspC domain-containing protein [Chloroflexota bacterium]